MTIEKAVMYLENMKWLKGYSNTTVDGVPLDNVIDDIIALLKAQEPRLITEADFDNADSYGFLPAWVEDKDDTEIICDCIKRTAITEPDEDYHYRYWTSKPRDTQRSETPWVRLN